MTLSGKDKSKLRAEGQTLKTQLTVGKNGATEAVLKEMNLLFTTQSLIKVKILGDAARRKSVAQALEAAIGCEQIAQVGSSCLFYREKTSPFTVAEGGGE